MILTPRLKVLAIISAIVVLGLVALGVSNYRSGKLGTKADVNNTYSPYFFSTGGPVGNSDALRPGGQATWQFSHTFDPNSVLANQYGRGACAPPTGAALSFGEQIYESGVGAGGCIGVVMEYSQLTFEVQAVLQDGREETVHRSTIINPGRVLVLFSGQSRAIDGVSVTIPQGAKQVKSSVSVFGTIGINGESSPVFGTGISAPVFGSGISSPSGGRAIPVNYQQVFKIFNLTSSPTRTGSSTSTTTPATTPAPAQTSNLIVPGIDPTVDLKIKKSDGTLVTTNALPPNSPVTLQWSQINGNARHCSALGDWGGTKAVSGTEVINNVTGPKSFTLTCISALPTGPLAATATVNVSRILPSTSTPTTAPTATPVDLKVNNLDGPVTIPKKGSVTLSWTTTGVGSCKALGSVTANRLVWKGDKAAIGSEVIKPAKTGKFYLNCKKVGQRGSFADVVEVKVR